MVYTLRWIKTNLGHVIADAVAGTAYTEDWLAAMVYRETGFLIERYAYKRLKFDVICSLMKGDYTQRPHETEKQYHGFGFWQIDIASYPDFVKSGDWKDPAKCVRMAISVLDSKKKYLTAKFPELEGNSLERAVTAAYNCGEGNEFKALSNHFDVDAFTYGHDYVKTVWLARATYKTLT